MQELFFLIARLFVNLFLMSNNWIWNLMVRESILLENLLTMNALLLILVNLVLMDNIVSINYCIKEELFLVNSLVSVDPKDQSF